LDTPIIRIANTTYFDNGQVMDFTELTLNSPKYQLSYIKQ
jgi:DNA-binding GntR family transcriptional regulator